MFLILAKEVFVLHVLQELKKEKIEMKTNQILTDEEINEGLILTCQSIPKSNNIIIDFDDV